MSAEVSSFVMVGATEASAPTTPSVREERSSHALRRYVAVVSDMFFQNGSSEDVTEALACLQSHFRALNLERRLRRRSGLRSFVRHLASVRAACKLQAVSRGLAVRRGLVGRVLTRHLEEMHEKRLMQRVLIRLMECSSVDGS